MNDKKGRTLPKFAERLLRRTHSDDMFETIRSDLTDQYACIAEEKGCFRARLWVTVQVFKILRGRLFNKLYWSAAMFKNYIKIALRHIRKHRGYSFINIAGLAVGFACCLLITLWILDELSYDRFHANVDQVYHVLAQTDVKNVTVTPTLLGPTLKEEFPEIIDMTRFHRIYGGTSLSYEERTFFEDRLRAADPSFFRIFTFPFIKGDPETALEDPHAIVLTQSAVEKYFQDEDPMGKTLTLNDEHALTVTGVIQDVPANSTLRFDMIVPMAFRISLEGDWYMWWTNFNPNTFIKLRPDCRVDEINEKIANVIPAHGGSENDRLAVLPFRQRYFTFYSHITYVVVFAVIAVFVLLIACFNFINLSTARSTHRAKEISMRKISGAHRRQIILQFMGESLLFSFVAAIIAHLLIMLLLPSFNAMTGKKLTLDGSSLILFSVGFTVFAGIAAGVYPALSVSGFQPVKVLKGKLKSGAKGSRLRKSLVVIQFSISALLMIGMGVVVKQLRFIRNADVGYDKEQLIHIAMRGGSEEYYRVLQTELSKESNILSITSTNVPMPYFSWHQTGFHWGDHYPEQRNISISCNMVNYDFTQTFRITLKEGRDFSQEYATDVASGCLINEAMRELMGLERAEGVEINQGNHSNYRIIGVVENFHFKTFEKQIEPLILRLRPDQPSHMYIRIAPENIPKTLDVIRKTWKRLVPKYPFEYRFLDEEYERGFRNVERTGRLVNSFTLLAVMISCLGLFGLASFTAEQRTKEIGIRKVLGSSISEILLLMTGEFTKWVLIANVIAWPAAYFVMTRFLNMFVYRTSLGVMVFILSAVATLVIALTTVGYQAIRAARSNPVDALRYE